MKFHIIGSGKIKEKYLTAGIDEFLKRLKPYGQVQITEIGEERMPDNPSAAEKKQILDKEGERLLKNVRPGSYLFVLDVQGELISFGRITLTHQMIRMILTEQIYRAVKIMRHEPYHL